MIKKGTPVFKVIGGRQPIRVNLTLYLILWFSKATFGKRIRTAGCHCWRIASIGRKGLIAAKARFAFVGFTFRLDLVVVGGAGF